jgi:hypothetical protein
MGRAGPLSPREGGEQNRYIRAKRAFGGIRSTRRIPSYTSVYLPTRKDPTARELP